METHAHHLHKAPGNKFWHYFYEFLMLFLAVFCGSLAENLREHTIERKKETQYIRSLVADLREDIVEIKSSLKNNILKFKGVDTLTEWLDSGKLNTENEKKLYRLWGRYATNVDIALFHDKAMKQLLNSGNLRLIRKQSVSDSIMAYYQEQENVNGQGDIYNESAKRTLYYSEDIFDHSASALKLADDGSFYRERNPDKMKLMTNDSKVLKKYSQIASTTNGLTGNYILMLTGIGEKAEALLAFLKIEYHLE
jgi:hypothetical protein